MKKLLFYILISLIFISCSRSLFEEPDEYYHLSDGLNKLGNYKTGSYWIYHNDSLNLNDTVKVIDNKMTQSSRPMDSHSQYYDKLIITFKSSYYDSIIYDYLDAYCDCYYRIHKRYQKNSDSLDTEDFLLRHAQDNSYNAFRASIDYLHNYTLNGKTYDNVIYYISEQSKNEYYFVSNSGIIKIKNYKISKENEWYLLNSKIVN